ncbi:uncharacterized protein LOC129598673 isoform X2 [Paramacrobiotus metropolitanus]|nr:uncharacterized protein LOC129598673 isoform X2 [Paramacrobiotus metropolitanus]
MNHERSRSPEGNGYGGGGGGRSYRGGGGGGRAPIGYAHRDEKSGGYRLHIANISDDVSQGDVTDAFSKYGSVKEFWMSQDSPRFGFLVFETQDEAESAISNLNDSDLHGNTIRVSWAKPRDQSSRGGRGGRGGSYGGGGGRYGGGGDDYGGRSGGGGRGSYGGGRGGFGGGGGGGDRACFNCGRTGHMSRDCRSGGGGRGGSRGGSRGRGGGGY